LDSDGPNAYLDYGTREQAGVWQTIGEYGGVPGVFLVRANGMMNGKDFSIMPGQNPDSKPNPNGNTSEMAIGRGDSHSHPAMGLTVFNANSVSDNPGDSSVLNGYNVYRTNELGVNFAKLNANLLTDTTYVDTYPSTLVSGNFKYYVTTLYKNSADNSILCESPSDTILVTFPAVGINELNNGQIMIYPNPATEVISVKSNFTITRIDVMNFVGQTIYTNSDVAMKTAKINVVTFKSGVYFVKVSTSEGVRTVKITVTH
jgi:hypothetical protein